MSTARNKNEMLEAAGLLAEGRSVSEVARTLGRTEKTIRTWMKNEDIRTAYRECIWDTTS